MSICDNSEKPEDNKDNKIEGKKIKLTLKKINLVATWKYGIDTIDCTICGKNLMMPVYEQQEQEQEQESQKKFVFDKRTLSADVTIGTCEHGFHTHCINSWTSEGNISCPFCKTMWKGSKNVGSSVYVYKSTDS